MTAKARFSVRDIRRQGQRRTSNLYDTLFTRNVSVWVTAVLAPLGTSPNLVTLVNFVVGMAGCVLIGFGAGPAAVLGGIVLLHLYAVLDSVDGELARLLDRRSLRGMFLEDWSAYGLMNAFPIAVALYMVAVGASQAALILAVLYAAVGRNAMPALRRAIAESQEVPPPTRTGPGHRSVRVGGWMAFVENHLLHQTNLRLVLTVLIIVHLASGVRLPLEVAFYGYVLALFAREVAILFFGLRRDLVQQELTRLRGPTATAPTPPAGP
jgi:phosphatidylglycerophosphate synthase